MPPPVTLNDLLRAYAAARDRGEPVELVAHLLPLFPRQEVRQGHRPLQNCAHTVDVSTRGWPAARSAQACPSRRPGLEAGTPKGNRSRPMR